MAIFPWHNPCCRLCSSLFMHDVAISCWIGWMWLAATALSHEYWCLQEHTRNIYFILFQHLHTSAHTHRHTHPFSGPFSRTTRSAGTRKVKPIWILLKQETVSGSGISWAICKSAPRARQITTPATHHSVLYRPDALPATQSTQPQWNKIK